MIQELSNYSTERYYILSELEQKLEMRFLDEAPALLETNNKTPAKQVISPLQIVYKLWIYKSHPLSELLLGIKTLLDSVQQPVNTSTLCLVIDLLLPPGKRIEGNLYDEMKSVLSHELVTKYVDCMVVIAAFDNVAACPGLEFCFNCTQQISPGYISDDLVGILIVQSRSEMLGADPDREPDAVNEVYQAYCTCEVDGVDSFLSRLSKDFGKKKAPSTTTKSEKTLSVFPPLILVALLFALIFAFLPIPVDGDWQN